MDAHLHEHLVGRRESGELDVGHGALVDARIEVSDLCSQGALGLDLNEEVNSVLGVVASIH